MQRELLTRWRALGGVALVGLLLAIAGCGEGAASVSGKVTYNGTPVSGGTITFHGTDGKVDGTWIDPDGKYIVTRAPVGEVKVTVEVGRAGAPPKMPKSKDVPGHPGDKGGGTATGKPMVIPAKYKDPAQSGLTYTLKSGSQVIDIDLKP